jgi:hypothetical protein
VGTQQNLSNIYSLDIYASFPTAQDQGMSRFWSLFEKDPIVNGKKTHF